VDKGSTPQPWIAEGEYPVDEGSGSVDSFLVFRKKTQVIGGFRGNKINCQHRFRFSGFG